MRIEGQETVAASQAEVWRGVNDPAVLRACTPGLTKLDETTPDHFDAALELKLPAVSGRFDGTADVVEREEPRRLKLKVKGKGAPGFVDGSAELVLAPAEGDASRTLVRYVADVQIGGQVARLGQRMISGVTKEMAGQFFEALARTLDAQRAAAAGAPDGGASASAPAPPNAFLAFLQLAWRTLLNLLGLSKRS
jgi:hypothetical protein